MSSGATFKAVTSQAFQQSSAGQARHWISVDVPHLRRSTGLDAVLDSVDHAVLLSPSDCNKIRRERPLNNARLFTVRLVHENLLRAAKEISVRYPSDRIAVVNAAHRDSRGGDVLNGKENAESWLCMATSLHASLRRSFYPLRESEVIYSPAIVVAKTDNGEFAGAKMPPAWHFIIDVLSAAPVNMPRLRRDDTLGQDVYEHDADRQSMSDTFEALLVHAARRFIDRMVFPPFGCSEHGNPVHEVVTMMKDHLLGHGTQDPIIEWSKHGLREVLIAIPEDEDPIGCEPFWNSFVNQFQSINSLPTGLQHMRTEEVACATILPGPPAYWQTYLALAQNPSPVNVSDALYPSLLATGGTEDIPASPIAQQRGSVSPPLVDAKPGTAAIALPLPPGGSVMGEEYYSGTVTHMDQGTQNTQDT